ncbi:MAG TPA: hypothetical protein VMT63_11290 [Bacteroidales bacterium]|nr:hypothetical protein [Bacteroidales bacterium]
MTKRILYLTMTDWNWAKQRPQFIAEGLSEYYEVEYLFQKTYRKRNLIKNPELTGHPENLRIRQLFRLPFNRFKFVKWLNGCLLMAQLLYCIRRCEIIWITFPEFYPIVKPLYGNQKILIYDCMDDFQEFDNLSRDKSGLRKLFKAEHDLVKDADLVFVSSGYLASKLQKRFGSDFSQVIVNNALSWDYFSSFEQINEDPYYKKAEKDKYNLIYTGTISSWFDFNLVRMSTERFDTIEYILLGPSEIEIPVSMGIRYQGPVRHDRLPSELVAADALVMPFLSTELIRSVDPVKVYEYISTGKPVIIPCLPETLKFEKFVYLYSDTDQYMELVSLLVTGNLHSKASKREITDFVNGNIWEVRIASMLSALNAYS